MKRNFNCNDSLTHFLSLEGEMKSEEGCIYTGEFQSMVDGGGSGGGDGGGDGEDSGGEETGQFSDKKRRLSNHQVKSLEKIFEVDNKLDPDRKVKVAQDLGLQPRQVAIWFQNRRARWKTKHLERDYNVLKSNYDALEHNYHKLEQEKEVINKENRRARWKTKQLERDYNVLKSNYDALKHNYHKLEQEKEVINKEYHLISHLHQQMSIKKDGENEKWRNDFIPSGRVYLR